MKRALKPVADPTAPWKRRKMTMKHRIALVWALSVWLIIGAVPATASYMDLMDYPRLEAELGAAVPTGDGIQVMHVEAKEGSDYIPHADNSEFETPDKSFTNVSASSPGSSSHATTVGINFYGNDTSVAPDVGIDEAVLNYEAGDWIYSFLNFNQVAKPETTTARIANHSWLAGTGVPSIDGNILRRIDFTIEEDDLIQVAGAPNISHEAPIFKDAYNEISVGLTSGQHVSGTTDVDTLYTDDRVAPTLVAPGFNKADSTTFTSWAAPMVSATAAMLLEVAQDASLSSGTITNRTRTIQHAETSEVVKAVLMAGADRAVDNPRGADLTDYTVDTTNNLDSRYGAGQMNIYNAYRILAAGEQESQQDGSSGTIEAFGWDYDPAFGGDAGSNVVGSYCFTPSAAWMLDRLQATLVWNLDVDIDVDIDLHKVEFIPTFYDLDLLLLDVTGGGEISLASSTSTEHNTETVYYEGLTLGNTYELRVAPKDGQGDFAWDYALAWQVPEPATLALLALGGLILFHRRRHLGRG